MKRFVLLFIFTGLIPGVWANSRPEMVPSKLLELKPKSWYLETFRTWKSYLEANPTDESGWLELYKAATYGGVSSEEVATIVDKIAYNFPESSIHYFVKSKQLGWTEEGVKLLSEAISKANSQMFLEERMLLSEFELDGNRKEFSSKVFHAGLITKSTLNYGYNVLMSVGENGVLFTDATHTTIPIWILQDVMSVRQDVAIINLELGRNEDYLEKKLRNYGLQNSIGSPVVALPEVNRERDFYYALTLPRNNLETLEDRLYVVGLASQLESTRLDHYGSLKENIESKFLLDYLTIDFNGEPNTSLGKVLETNYIVPFMMLKEYYDELGDDEKSEFWKDKLLNVADKSQLRTRVELLLNKKDDDRENFSKVDIDVKGLDKKMVKVKGNVYASIYELSNEEYWFYLNYLEQNDFTELFEKSKADLSKYDELSRAMFSNYHYSSVNYKALQAKRTKNRIMKSPAVDMTYEAAKAYCEWLTFQYNLQEGRKYKKVKFRLPAQNEWTMAALGYKEFTSWTLEENTVEAWEVWVDGKGTRKKKKELKKYDLSEYEILYPWWHPNINLRDKIRNQFECYLGNVKAPDEITCPAGIKGDGFTMMSPMGTYFPNKMGLFDVSGNVAEMINEEGKAMGGSWNHPAEECTIKSINPYDGSDVSVGFRVFMEIIEE